MNTPNPAIPSLEKTRDLNVSLAPSQPLVLFPVRLETRFFPVPTGGSELRVRVYPDQIHIDSHEPDLTADELTWGKHFWEQTWRAGDDKERAKAAWRQLADRFDPARAAWVARALKPLNLQDHPASPLAPDEPLRFPSPNTKPDAWTRAPHTRLLPSRWIVLGYQSGRLVINVQGNLIVDQLATGPDPSRSATFDTEGIDEGMKWLVDFEAAEAVGMAMRANLTAAETAAGLDFLLVMGIKDVAGATNEGSQRLAEIFNAHHYSDGLSFLTQGAPTNNTQDAASGFSSQDAGHEESYWAEHAGPEFQPGDGSNADVLTTALGLANAESVFARLPHATAKEPLDAKQMNTALWQATWGYFLLQMLGVGSDNDNKVGGANENPLTDEDIAWMRDHFIQYVRAGGPLPALRVSKQPYGVLPVTSLDAWKPQPGQESQAGREVVLRDFLIRLRDKVWRQNLAEVPRLGRSEEIDPTTGIDKDLAEVLSMDGLSSSYAIRHLMGQHYLEHLWVLMAADLILTPAMPAQTRAQIAHERFRTWFAGQAALAGNVLQTLGVQSRPRLSRALFSPPAAAFRDVLVQADQGPQLSPNYIESLLAGRDLAAIQKETLQPPPPHTLLYLLLRHSMLLEYVAAGSRVLIKRGLLQPAQRREQELVDMLPEAQSPKHVIRRMDSEITLPDGSKGTLGSYLFDFAERDPDLQSLNEFRTSLTYLSKLEGQQVGRLEQLLAGTLDLCSHRLDAWITSFATKRLDEMRKTDANSVLVGGYGWVMNLKPTTAQTPAAPLPGESGPIFQSASNPGFVHTPSLAQAATAAVLRSGHLAHAGGQTPNDPLAIDLSSARVRLAEWLLDGVRQGQPLAALLGYRFERGLHEQRLDPYIDPFRRIAPFSELQKALDASDAAEAEAARVAALPHPDLPAAQAALADAQQQKAQLLAQQSPLTGQIAIADHRVQELSPQVGQAQDEVDALQDILSTPGDLTPSQLAKARSQLVAAKAKLTKLKNDLNAATASGQQARSQLAMVNAQLPGADLVIQQAQQRVNNISGPGKNPAFPPVKQAAEAAAAHYQQLLEQYRRQFLLPQASHQDALESVTAINVVDGLGLLKLWEEQAIPWGQKNLPAVGLDEQKKLIVELDRLADAVDAVSDALLAESVYQTVRGNPLRTASTVEAIAGGEAPPPELEVVRTPRTGIALTHRLVTLFSGEPALPAAWRVTSLRADAEPHLNAWVARLLGDPPRIRCQVEQLDAVTGNVIGETKDLRLDELRLSPLDFIYAVEGGQGGQQAEIEQRILYTMMRRQQDGFPPGSQLRINPNRKAEWEIDELGYGEFSELLRTVRKLIGSVRAIDGDDLNLPERSDNAGIDSSELERRADTAVQELRLCQSDLKAQVAQPNTANLQDLRDLLLRAANFGIAGAVPLSAAGDAATDRRILLNQAASVENELAKRVDQLAKLQLSKATAESRDVEKHNHALARLQTVFGKGFVVLPRFTAANPDELEKALTNRLKLQDGDPLAASTWFQRMARLRDGVGRLNDVLVYTEAVGNSEKLKLSIAQLPHNREDRWVGLPLLPETSLPGGKLSLAVQSTTPVDVHQPMTGLLVDEWVEVVPNASETTGLAFQYDQPNTAPPQSILLAVPPAVGEPWTIWSLQQVLLETLDLARIRAVDPDALDEVGHYLPAAYFALNLAGHTISTDFTTIK